MARLKQPSLTIEDISDTMDAESPAVAQTRVRRIFSYLQTMFMALVYMSSWEAAIGSV